MCFLIRGGESPLVMELGTPGCTGLKSNILALLFTIVTTLAGPCKVSTTTTMLMHLLPTLLLILPVVTADPNSFTMSAGLIDFRFQLTNATKCHHIPYGYELDGQYNRLIDTGNHQQVQLSLF